LQNGIVLPLLTAEATMANVYHVKFSTGETFDVTTEKHHDDLDEASFKKHLIDVVKGSATGVISGVIVGYVLKGRK
jgi:hypothetical protein